MRLFTAWTISGANPETRADLEALQVDLAGWQNDLQNGAADDTQRADISAACTRWAERLLEHSGLLKTGRPVSVLTRKIRLQKDEGIMLVKHEKDCEEIIANDGCRLRELLHPERDPEAKISYSFAIAYVEPGKATYRHYLRQSEVYYIIEGIGNMHVGEETKEVQSGDAVYIPPGKEQWIENIGQNVLVFAALVSPPWRLEDDIRLDEQR